MPRRIPEGLRIERAEGNFWKVERRDSRLPGGDVIVDYVESPTLKQAAEKGYKTTTTKLNKVLGGKSKGSNPKKADPTPPKEEASEPEATETGDEDPLGDALGHDEAHPLVTSEIVTLEPEPDEPGPISAADLIDM